MSNIKVSEMPEASELNNNDLLMVVQNGANKKVKANKLQLTGVTLFESSEGTNEDITLNDDIANYKEFEIQYALVSSTNDIYSKSTGRLLITQAPYFVMDLLRHNTDKYIQIISQLSTITNNKLTFISTFHATINMDKTIDFTGSTARFTIYKVTGYK